MRSRPIKILAGALLMALPWAFPSFAAEFAILEEVDLRTPFNQGRYEEVIESAREIRSLNPLNETAWRMEGEALTRLGRYDEAFEVFVEAVENRPDSIRLHLLGSDAARFSRNPEAASSLMLETRYLVVSGSRFVRDDEALVAVGEAALLLGVEPRLALENFLRPGKDAKPPVRDAFLAIGRLSLEKKDFSLASRTFQQGIEAFPDDPDMWAGLAASFVNDDRSKLNEYATSALELNPRHVESRLLRANHLIDAEDYDGARDELALALEVNPKLPAAHALLAVLSHLQNDLDGEINHRADALATWPENPAVDHLIGLKLSQKYRFAEGADAQRRALRFDADYAPARMQLAQDLLRLGREAEGWSLAAHVHSTDAYNVAAYNLVSLRDRIDEFATLETTNFRLRMGAKEAEIYGPRALDLLERARNHLTHEYSITLPEQITVEIFPDPADFAVRTFGMPDNPGYLGVCFGSVVTVNSPTTRRANWEAVLWHEFTHVITLTITRNRMPRWLSEGISVYEELEQNPSWGQQMSADYWSRIMSGRTQPISEMSAAFLKASSGDDLQFAYFQSYLVVKFLAETYGFPAIRATLEGLRNGDLINDALAANIAPLDELDSEFAKFAVRAAHEAGGSYDLSKPNNEFGLNIAGLDASNIHKQLSAIDEDMENERWEEARKKLNPIVSSGLYLPHEENIHSRLARVCRELGDTTGEQVALETVVAHEGGSLNAVSRLLEIARDQEDWEAVDNWADHWLAINPVAVTPWRALLTAGENTGNADKATKAGTTLLLLDPPDRAAVHYRIARQYLATDQADQARRNVLLALEEAPRYRKAHALLAELSNPSEIPIEIEETVP